MVDGISAMSSAATDAKLNKALSSGDWENARNLLIEHPDSDVSAETLQQTLWRRPPLDILANSLSSDNIKFKMVHYVVDFICQTFDERFYFLRSVLRLVRPRQVFFYIFGEKTGHVFLRASQSNDGFLLILDSNDIVLLTETLCAAGFPNIRMGSRTQRITNDRTLNETLSRIKCFVSQPKSLQQLCRTEVRSRICCLRSWAFAELGIPHAVRTYLQLREL